MQIKRVAILCCCLAFGGRLVSACDTNRNLEPPVNINFWCSQNWISFFWDAYDFDQGDWDNGFGFESACNLRRPLARTFQAIELVNFSSPVNPTTTDDFSGNFLHWAGNYTMREYDELDARCGDGTLRAYTTWGTIDDTAEFYIPFFYGENVVERAGTLVHESRHADWCGHNGNDGTNVCLAKSKSCDEKLNDGCTGAFSPSGKGADGFQTMWLWWYAFEADSTHSNATMKDFARDEANRILDTMFDVHPCFHITSNGDKIITC